MPEGDDRTEVGRLTTALNRMLSRIESAFRAQQESEAQARSSEERMRRFVADASHELPHAADLDPRLRRALPAGRGAPAPTTTSAG